MKLTKVHIAILAVVGVTLLLGISLIGLNQIRGGGRRPPDPGADARKKYIDSKKKRGDKDSLVAEDDSGEVSGVIPEGSPLTEKPPPPKELPPIQAPGEGDDRQIVDSGPERTPTPNEIPGIPTGLLDQSPPEDAQREKAPLMPVNIRTKPGRYLFNNQTTAALTGQGVAFQSKAPDFSLDHFAPAGEIIDIVFVSNAASNDFDVPVSAAVWTPFYFQGNKLLDTGDKLMGRAGKKNRKRILVSFDRIVFTDGQSAKINAIGIANDGTTGIPGFQIGDPLVNQIGTILLGATGEFLKGLQGKETETTATGRTESVSGDLESAFGDAFEKISESIQVTVAQEMEDSKPYILVPAGTRAKAYLVEPIDVSQRSYGD